MNDIRSVLSEAEGRIDRAVSAILAALEAGEIPDDDVFDAIYAPRWRELSYQHWTPIETADVAVAWLTSGGARRVLDVGAGVGKLCVYGALTTNDVAFVGVEQRADLVEEARRTAARLGVEDRVEIRHGTLDDVDPAEFDALYLYNPFAENLGADDTEIIDSSVPLTFDRFRRDVSLVERWLGAASIGTRLVTLHGFGGHVPDSFRLVASQRDGWDALRAWEKHAPARRR
ncbi:methyltransferase domain-containing protein [Sandaracinus amylolyticus]|uniref:methyltransferase domain-containing protein n=1 Tax=Sandaracinus amylolyticus TaxID=927083 RepID=UPI001F3F67FC|nr:methyltransferase domain-containing protein [Sandaracinus amylolyticus]UJR86001.1 Hypothetical protein I5071_80820 [Sandaracinus amylolyticus]